MQPNSPQTRQQTLKLPTIGSRQQSQIEKESHDSLKYSFNKQTNKMLMREINILSDQSRAATLVSYGKEMLSSADG